MSKTDDINPSDLSEEERQLIASFNLDRPFEEWSDEELDDLAATLAETDTRVGAFLAEQRGGQS